MLEDVVWIKNEIFLFSFVYIINFLIRRVIGSVLYLERVVKQYMDVVKQVRMYKKIECLGLLDIVNYVLEKNLG